ncbi:MAG: hypothetical protein LBH37_01065, partial [Oscillospiraceae bacterium]|nr:hypothetical protein [Oscillospiraceae bacterium]
MKRNIVAFKEELAKNENLKGELQKLRSEYGSGVLDPASSYTFLREALIPFANSKGYNFTPEEYIEHELEIERKDLYDLNL